MDWASLIGGSKFTVFDLFYFVFVGNFPSASPRDTYFWRGDLTVWFGRLTHGGAYFRNIRYVDLARAKCEALLNNTNEQKN